MKPSIVAGDRARLKAGVLDNKRDHASGSAKDLSSVAIFAAVGLIGLVQLTSWVLNRGKTSPRLRIL